jgi:hypothetical protein
VVRTLKFVIVINQEVCNKWDVQHVPENLVNKANLVQNFLSVFNSFLYMFQATMCPSSGEITVSMCRLVFVTLYG